MLCLILWYLQDTGVVFVMLFFFFKQKTAYEITVWLEFRRVLFRSTSFLHWVFPVGGWVLFSWWARPTKDPEILIQVVPPETTWQLLVVGIKPGSPDWKSESLPIHYNPRTEESLHFVNTDKNKGRNIKKFSKYLRSDHKPNILVWRFYREL